MQGEMGQVGLVGGSGSAHRRGTRKRSTAWQTQEELHRRAPSVHWQLLSLASL